MVLPACVRQHVIRQLLPLLQDMFTWYQETKVAKATGAAREEYGDSVVQSLYGRWLPCSRTAFVLRIVSFLDC